MRFESWLYVCISHVCVCNVKTAATESFVLLCIADVSAYIL